MSGKVKNEASLSDSLSSSDNSSASLDNFTVDLSKTAETKKI